MEGPIGVGKTTLAKRLADTLGYPLMLEPVAENPFLRPVLYRRRQPSLANPTVLLTTPSTTTGRYALGWITGSKFGRGLFNGER